MVMMSRTGVSHLVNLSGRMILLIVKLIVELEIMTMMVKHKNQLVAKIALKEVEWKW